MGKTKEEILLDLGSTEPERITSAIHELKNRIKDFKEFSLVPFGTEIFKSFGDSVSEDVQLDFLNVIQKYKSFDPPLSAADRMSEQIKLLLGYAERYVAFEIALKLKVAKLPVDAVIAALQEMHRQGLRSEVNFRGASYLISRLLDGKNEVRKATLDMLQKWLKEEPYLRIREYITPQLNPDEVESLNQ